MHVLVCDATDERDRIRYYVARSMSRWWASIEPGNFARSMERLRPCPPRVGMEKRREKPIGDTVAPMAPTQLSLLDRLEARAA